jgi:hypothetical protein
MLAAARIAVLPLLLATAFARAGELPTIDDLYVGDEFKYPVLKLRPTQAAYGALAVRKKSEDLADIREEEGKKALRKELKKEVIPVVAAPDGRFYLIDHHHLARAAHDMGRENVFCILEKDYSKLGSMDEFWKRMREKKWVRDVDELGRKIRIPDGLPKSVLQLRNDPYRSLAWYVRQSGGYRKSNVEFAEFEWADFFRKDRRFDVGTTAAEFRRALAAALEIVHTKETKHLPGWTKKPAKCQNWMEEELESLGDP